MVSGSSGRRKSNGQRTIYRYRNGSWAGQVYLNESGGKRRRRTVYGITRQEVEQQLVELRSKSAAGAPITPLDLTVGMYLEEWLSQVISLRVRPNTLAGYRHHADRHLLPDLGAKSLARLTARDVRVY